MIENKQALSLKRAVFLSENAYYNNIDYDRFCRQIQRETDFVKKVLAAEKLDATNKDAVKWVLYRLFSDTIQVAEERRLPFAYDFDDPFGKKDIAKMFVSKLLTTRKGQCHSMPLLYLILAEELGVEAWLSHSPQHSYIKLKNARGNWFNFETTNGHYTNDAWILSSNFIKSEAIKSGIYLDTLSKRELIASCLNDLATNYADKYKGYDTFVEKCAEKTLAHHPNDVNALKIKVNYHTFLFKYVIEQLHYPPPPTLPQYPQAFEILRQRDEAYKTMDNAGYEDMPDEVYKAWLSSFDTEHGKQPNEIIRP